jgi:hypothetical protein
MNSTEKSSSGLWDALAEMESVASSQLRDKLLVFSSPFRLCYEAGVQAPTLKCKRQGEIDILLAALFLKRSLTDFRSIWLLINTGYTSQAASIAASLFENALAITSIVSSNENVEQLRSNKSGDLPWGAQLLAQNQARRWQKEALERDESFDSDEYEKAWREIYSSYKWLCKIKHPTLRSVSHDAGSTSLAEMDYVVMASPDIRTEDLAVKATVLMITFSRVYEAIRQFVLALGCEEESDEYGKFEVKLNQAYSEAIEAFTSFSQQPLPFNIGDSKIAKNWAG